MNAVITSVQARQITRGRTPLVPVEYETAIKALTECVTFDETKYWSDKADALAAWAKIYHSNDTLVKAKRLKLHAYRRMGEIAQELRPTGPKLGNTGAGRLPGAISLLREHGLKRSEASAARKLALMSDSRFSSILKRPNAPTTVAHNLWPSDPVWQKFSHTAMTMRAFFNKNTPASVARCLKNDQYAATARKLVVDLTEWLDEFEQRLPKETS